MLVGRLLGASVGGEIDLDTNDPTGYGTFDTLLTGWVSDWGVPAGSRAMGFYDSGNYVAVSGHVDDLIIAVPLSTPYDVTTDGYTGSDAQKHDDGSNVFATMIDFYNDGDNVVYYDSFGGTIGVVRYMSTAGSYNLTDVSMGTPTGAAVTADSSINNAFGSFFTDNGGSFWLSGSDGFDSYLAQWTLTTPYKVNTGSFNSEIVITSVVRSWIQDPAAKRVLWLDDNRVLREFTYTDEADISTWTETANTKNVSGTLNTADGRIGVDASGNLIFFETAGSEVIRRLNKT